MSLSPAGTYMLSSYLGFSNCVDVYLSCRNIRGDRAGGRQELPWYFDSKLWSLLSGWVRKKSVKYHLVSCSQLVWLTAGGGSEAKATTKAKDLEDPSEQHSPAGVPWQHLTGISLMIPQLERTDTDFLSSISQRKTFMFCFILVLRRTREVPKECHFKTLIIKMQEEESRTKHLISGPDFIRGLN